MPTERKRISKARSVNEEVRNVEFGPTVGTDVAEAVLGPHVTAAFGTGRAGYHRPRYTTVGKTPFAQHPHGFAAPVPTHAMTTGQVMLALAGLAVVVFTTGFVVIFLLS
jgi:hypothetical protein